MFNKVRLDFPMIKNMDKNNIVYLDNASTTHKPLCVIKNQLKFFCREYSSIRRSNNIFSIKIEDKIENTRYNISTFINSNYREIIFTKGTTESINIIINIWAKLNIKKNDNIIISISEHHSNILPWIHLSKEKKIEIKFIKIDKYGNLKFEELENMITKNTKLISINHVSNVLGVINPIKDIIEFSKNINNKILFLIDGAQYISHNILDVKYLNCDFYVFSGHKMYAPNGIGILYIKENILKKIKILNEYGGSILKDIDIINKKMKFIDYPWKFESGTLNYPSILGLNKSIKYINKIKLSNIIKWENKILKYALDLLKLNFNNNIYIYGDNKLKNKIGIISFNILNINYKDIDYILNKNLIIIRTGNQCAIPLMNYLKIKGLCRISISMYNNFNDIDKLIKNLIYIKNLFENVNQIP